MDTKKLLKKKGVLVATAFVAGVIVTLLATQASNSRVPLGASLVDPGERIALITNTNQNSDEYFQGNGFYPWNDMRYRYAGLPESVASYIFKNVDGGDYSVWVTYGKRVSYIRNYLASSMPITVNNGSESFTHSINLKADWDAHRSDPDWQDQWVRVGDGNVSVVDGDTLTVSFSNKGNEGTSFPMLGHAIIRYEGGGGGEGEGSVCGDGIVDSVEECDDGNDDPGDGCNSACREVAEHDKIQYTATTWEISDSPDPEKFDLNFNFILYSRSPLPAEGYKISIMDTVTGWSEELVTDVQPTGVDKIAYTKKGLLMNQSYSIEIYANDQFRETIEVIATACGNGTVDEDEECDDGNQNNNDSCTNSCHVCGDYLLKEGEKCTKDKISMLLDVNEDGKISVHEPPMMIERIIGMMEEVLDSGDGTQLDSKYDVNFDGQITPLDLLSLISFNQYDENLVRLREIFSMVDADQDGHVSPVECLYAERSVDADVIREVVTDFDYDNDVEHLRNAFDQDGNGFVTSSEADLAIARLLFIVNNNSGSYDSKFDMDDNGRLTPLDILMLVGARNEYVNISE